MPSEISQGSRIAWAVTQLIDDPKAVITAEAIQSCNGDAISPADAALDIEALTFLSFQKNREREIKLAPGYRAFAKGLDAKSQIAEESTRYFDAGSTIAAGAGSTVALAMWRILLQANPEFILTNSLEVAKVANAAGSRQISMVGGTYYPDANALVGDEAAAGFSNDQIRCKDTLLSVSGVFVSGDDVCLSVPYQFERDVVKAQLGHARSRIVILANYNRLGAVNVFQVGSIRALAEDREVIFITNRLDDWKADLSPGDCANAENTIAKLHALKADAALGGRFSLVEVPRPGGRPPKPAKVRQ